MGLPYAKRAEKELLSDSFGVQGIPSFVVLNPDGTVLTTDGRSKVMSDPKGESLPDGWLPQPFNDVNDDPSPLNEEQCLIMLGSFTASQKDQSLNSFGSSQGLQKANSFSSTFPPTVPFSSVMQSLPRSLKQVSKSSLRMSKLVE